MVKNAFVITCGFILGALVVENKQYFSHRIPVPVSVLPDAGVYEGDLNLGRFHGHGRIVWPNKKYYEGDFVNGMFQGKGLLQTATFLYEGEFVSGHASGEGTIEYANGDKYQGSVKFGQPDGTGILRTAHDVYKGDFSAGQYHGRGELSDSTGSHYVGTFAKGQFHGEGVYTYTMVDDNHKKLSETVVVYRGQFVNGSFSGDGSLTEKGKHYEGQFIDWVFHGSGVYRDEEGEYTGQFVRGVYEGKGVYLSKSGIKYEGEFVDGRYHGQGVLTSSEGETYTGHFQYGLKHGKGTIDYAEVLDGIQQVNGEWEYGRLIKSDQPQLVVDKPKLAEYALYHQVKILDEQLSSLDAHDTENIDLYFVGIAGDGSQGVFRREMDFVKSYFDENYATKGKSITLVNSPLTYDKKPLATVTSIEKTLQQVAEKMDASNDILFVYLSSHGSRDFRLQLEQPGLSLLPLSADALGKMLKALPVQHKVVVISACFSGGFVNSLKHDSTMIIMASEHDKMSFGCHDRAHMTYFGEAFFKDSLHQSATFVDAFYRARDIVRGREAKEGFENSNPLIYKPKAIVAHLKKWREQRRQQIIDAGP
ncbi:hypothetical protein AB835_12485 [Candidatus Endobugula sertula]|uniref:Peptidase C13 n=1 Tax=Candidatus Endobugula sertula TaxID=62101 RepID=A0A1D2QME8_9GAMM|nr:hypothetical protein AB835_12485 [Candidatus Endobugula sertula]